LVCRISTEHLIGTPQVSYPELALLINNKGKKKMIILVLFKTLFIIDVNDKRYSLKHYLEEKIIIMPV